MTAQLIEVPSRLGDRNHPWRQISVPGHAMKRGEDLFVREIAGCSKEHERIRPGSIHTSLLFPTECGPTRTLCQKAEVRYWTMVQFMMRADLASRDPQASLHR